MKKFYTLMMLAMMAVTFTACDTDDDSYIAYNLEGTWEGDMKVYSNYGGHTYNSTYSEIEFLRNPYRYSTGSGYWVDYYSGAPWDYVANHIDWKVRDEIIYVYFREENTEIEIHDYYLSDNRFYGTIWDNGNKVRFSLVHTSSPNWSSYRWGYDDWYDDYYYAKSSTVDFDDTRAIADTTGVEKPKRGFGDPTETQNQ